MAGMKERTVERIKRDADRLSVWMLPSETLEKMAESLRQRLAEQEVEVRSANAHLEAAIAAGDAVRTVELRADVRMLASQWEETHSQLRRTETACLERRTRERLTELLGGPRRVLALDLFVMALVLGVLVLLTVESSVTLDQVTVDRLIWIDNIICAFFLAEFFLNWYCAGWKAWYLRRHWVDFLSSLPYAGLLRYGRLARLARLVRLVRLLRLVRILLFLWRGMDKLATAFNVPLLHRSLAILAAFFLLGGGAIYALEQPKVNSLSEGIWWSFATVITGGFADLHNPQTLGGRVLTGILIVFGLIVTGVFTASLASVFIEDDTQRMEYRQRQMEGQIAALRQEVAALSAGGAAHGGDQTAG